MSHSSGPAPVIALIDRLEASGALGSGGRLPALLRYLVLEELAGRGDRLKAYAVATEVLGRGRDFDPQQDAIVRSEVARLRRALDLYFATEGRAEPIRIAIGKGSLRPRIEHRDDSEASPAALSEAGGKANEAGATPPADRRGTRAAFLAGLVAGLALILAALAFFLHGRLGGPEMRSLAVIVLPVETGGGGPRADALRAALSTEIAAELNRHAWLSVSIAATPAERPGPGRAFALRPVLIADGAGAALTVALTRLPGNDLVWTGRYAASPAPEEDAARTRAQARALAEAVGREIAYPTGALVQAIVTESAATRADAADPVACMVNALRYWRDYEPRQLADARACLTRLTSADPSFVAGRAALAYLTLEDVHATIDPTRRARLLDEAAALIRAAPAADPLSASAAMAIAACRGETGAARAEAARLRALAPGDADMRADIANVLGPQALDWEAALADEEAAFALNANPPPWYPLASSLKALTDGDIERALKRITLVPQQRHARGQVLALVFASLAGAPLRRESAREALRGMGLLDRAAATRVIEATCWHPSVKAAAMEALGRAAEAGAF